MMRLRGLYPATVTPFTDDLAVDDRQLEQHLGSTVTADGVRGIVVNGHIGEILSLSQREQLDVVRAARAVRGPDQLVFAGINSHHVDELVDQAIAARQAGADGLLILPPIDVRPYRRLALSPQSVLHYFRALDAKVGLPMVVHQYPHFTGSAYSLDVLAELADLPSVVAIKAASVDVTAYTEVWDALSDRVSILAATDAPGLLGMLIHGCHGALIGIGCIVPEVWSGLIDDILQQRFSDAQRRFIDTCMPLMRAVFENQLPTANMESEASATKEALTQLGQLRSSLVRPPAVSVGAQRKQQIRAALAAARLLGEPLESTATREEPDHAR